MPGRLRRRSAGAELAADEGPFVSFTDLVIGILFLFLILVAALMLMHQEAMRKAAEQIREMQAKLDALAKLDADHAPYRLAIVYNSYQRPEGEKDWTFSRTVQVYRTPTGLCLDNIILRSNLSVAWKAAVKAENIPTAAKQDFVQMSTPCTLSAKGERWNTPSETGGVQRTSATMYSGSTLLHKKDGEEKIDLQYRILGVYDAYFGQATAQRAPQTPPAKRP